MAANIEKLKSTTFANKRFTRKQLSRIQQTVDEFKNLSRRELGHTVCEHLQWLTPTGTHKIQACLSALEQMEEIGLFTLPSKRKIENKSIQKEIIWTQKTEGNSEVNCQLKDLPPIRIQRVTEKDDVNLWNEYVDRHHYLKYRKPIGTYSRYFIVSGEHETIILGCLLFSATAVYSMAQRDQWIGWNEKDRKKRLNLILNNSRFLIFPWVNVKNLASKSLSIISKQIADDWERDHGYRPVLLETFVDPSKYKGTGYQASNWQKIGQTSGYNWNQTADGQDNSPKDIYIYPLTNNFRPILKNVISSKAHEKQARKISEKRSGLKSSDPFIRLWHQIMDIVSVQAREYDQKWQKRKRLIDTMLIILFIFRLVFSKNNQGYQTTIIELWDQCRRMNFPLPQTKPVAASALCNARKKLDANIFKKINTKVITTYENMETEISYQWKDHRVFGVDGSKINVPRPLKNQGYKTPSDNANYPQGLVSSLYQLKSQIPYDFDLVSHGNERALAINHLKVLMQDDVVVYDRGYFSYSMLYRHNGSKIHAVFRMKKNASKVVNDFMLSDKIDLVATILPSKSNEKEIKLKHPDIDCIPIKLRLVKYTYSGTTYTLGTTLLDEERYSITELSDLYHSRWGIEELYKISKSLIKIEEFHSHYEMGIKQELFAHFTLIAMNRIFTNKAEGDFEKAEAQSNLRKNEKPGKFKANLKNSLITMARNLEGLFIRHENMIINAISKILISIASCKQKERPNRKYDRVSMKPTGKWKPSKKEKTPSVQIS